MSVWQLETSGSEYSGSEGLSRSPHSYLDFHRWTFIRECCGFKNTHIWTTIVLPRSVVMPNTKAKAFVVSVDIARKLTSPVHGPVVSSVVQSIKEPPVSSRNSSKDDMLTKIGMLHEKLLDTSYCDVGPGRKYNDDVSACFGEDGGELKGKKFSVYVPRCMEWRENCHSIHVREHDAATALKLPEDCDIPGELQKAIVTHGTPIYDVEIKAKNKDTVATGINLTMFVEPNREFDTEYLVIGKEDESHGWKDITKKCSIKRNFDTFDRSVEITIPIKKSSKVWVVRIKRSFSELADVLLAVFFGQVLFRILMFYKVHNKTVNLRIIGVNDELCQKTVHEVCIAMESGFQKLEESNSKQLIKKGKLLVSFTLSGKTRKSFYFGLGGGKESISGQRGEFEFQIGELGSIPRIEIQTADEEVLWSYDVKNLINIDEHSEHTVGVDNVQPGFVPHDDEVKDECILYVARKVNKDWKELGTSLGIHMEDLNIIEANDAKHDIVNKCVNMLKLWQKNEKNLWDKPTLQSLKVALKKPEVGRYDIFPCSHLGNQISDATLAKVAHKLGGSWRMLGSILNIPDEDIDIIDSDKTNVVGKCMGLLQKWKQGENPSMEELIKALRDPVIKCLDLANDLENSCSMQTVSEPCFQDIT